MKKLFIIALSCAAFAACKKEEDKKVTPVTPLTAVLERDINASGARYQFYSIETGDTVPVTDSASTKWDIAFRSTTVLLNGGTSGPGQAGVIILDTLFNEVTTAPATGYAQDNALGKGIPTGSNNGWYNYAGDPTHTISPLAGKVFVIRTATGKYAKLEFISYYKGAPVAPNGVTDAGISRFYTIRYIYQPDGTTKLN